MPRGVFVAAYHETSAAERDLPRLTGIIAEYGDFVRAKGPFIGDDAFLAGEDEADIAVRNGFLLLAQADQALVIAEDGGFVLLLGLGADALMPLGEADPGRA